MPVQHQHQLGDDIYPHHPNHLLENPNSKPCMLLIVHNADQKAPEAKAEPAKCWSRVIVRADKLCSPNHPGLTPVNDHQDHQDHYDHDHDPDHHDHHDHH